MIKINKSFVEMGKNDNDFDIYRFITELNDTQSVMIELYDLSDFIEDNNKAYITVGLLVFDNNNFEKDYNRYRHWYDFTAPPSTGKTPMLTFSKIIELFNIGIDEIRNIYSEKDVIIGVGWMDEKRKRIYGKYLSRLGYKEKTSLAYDNEKEYQFYFPAIDK